MHTRVPAPCPPASSFVRQGVDAGVWGGQDDWQHRHADHPGWAGLGWAGLLLHCLGKRRPQLSGGWWRLGPSAATPPCQPRPADHRLSCTTPLPTHHLAELHSTPAHPSAGFPAPAGSLAFFIFRSRTTAFYFVNDVQARLGLGGLRDWAVWCLWPSGCIPALPSM